MTRQYAPQPDRRRQDPAGADPLEELRKRRAARESQEAELQAGQQAIEEAQAEIASQAQALQREIEGLLSANPEEFVIRFLQTEGQ
jgi:Pup-like protein